MEPIRAGDLTTVATGGKPVDGIVFDVLTSAKVVVALRDRARGPVLRTVARSALTERTEAGPDDRALQQLIRRTPSPARGAGRGPAGAGGNRGGHTRAVPHRATGK
jgi:hypothetical protein